MKAVVALRNPAAYRVRLQVILELSTRLDHLTLLTDSLDDGLRSHIQDYKNLTSVELGADDFSRLSEVWLSKNVVHQETPTVVHSTFGHLVRFFEMYSAQRNRHFKLVHSQYTANHDWFQSTRFQDYPMSYKYLGQRVKSFWTDRRMADAADAVFVVCPSHRDGLMRAHSLSEEKVYALPSEVDARYYQNHRPKRNDQRTLIFVGACYKNKGLDVLFQALPTIFELHPDLQVHLYGRTVQRQESWLMERLSEVAENGRVIMKGRVGPERLRQAFSDADLLVSPSRFEGSPRAVREALVGGCPCVLSSIPGHFGLDLGRQYISFVDGFDPAVWSEAIIEHLRQDDGEWRARAEAGVDAMITRHSPKAVADAWFNAYGEVFGSTG